MEKKNKFKEHPIWSHISKQYEFVKVLGSGTFGEVIQARHKFTNINVAIKLIRNALKDEY